MGKHLSLLEWEDVERRVLLGESQKDLAAEYGITASSVTKHLQGRGLRPPPVAHTFRQVWSDKVDLISGGSLHLVCTLDLRQASKRDREFVFTLLDALRDYREQPMTQQGT